MHISARDTVKTVISQASRYQIRKCCFFRIREVTQFHIFLFTIILWAELTRKLFGKHASGAEGAEVGLK